MACELAGRLDATVIPGDDFLLESVVVRSDDPESLFAACIDWKAARFELRDLVDVSILVQLPGKRRRNRLPAREKTIREWESQWHRAEDWYFSKVIARDDFDFLLDSDRFVVVDTRSRTGTRTHRRRLFGTKLPPFRTERGPSPRRWAARA